METKCSVLIPAETAGSHEPDDVPLAFEVLTVLEFVDEIVVVVFMLLVEEAAPIIDERAAATSDWKDVSVVSVLL